MTKAKRNYFRMVAGFVVAALGLGTFISGVVIAHTEHSAIHWTHIIASLVFLFAGAWLMSPATAEAIADAILKRLPTVWPGGMRKGDPAPQPGVPLPPSVTKQHPSDSEGA